MLVVKNQNKKICYAKKSGENYNVYNSGEVSNLSRIHFGLYYTPTSISHMNDEQLREAYLNLFPKRTNRSRGRKFIHVQTVNGFMIEVNIEDNRYKELVNTELKLRLKEYDV